MKKALQWQREEIRKKTARTTSLAMMTGNVPKITSALIRSAVLERNAKMTRIANLLESSVSRDSVDLKTARDATPKMTVKTLKDARIATVWRNKAAVTTGNVVATSSARTRNVRTEAIARMTRIVMERVKSVGKEDADQRIATDATVKMIARTIKIARTASATIKELAIVTKIVERMSTVWTRSVQIEVNARVIRNARSLLSIAGMEDADLRIVMFVTAKKIARAIKIAKPTNVWINPTARKTGNVERMRNVKTASALIDLIAKMTKIAKEANTAGMEDVDQRIPIDAMERVIAKMEVGIARTPSAEIFPSKRNSLVKKTGNVEKMKNALIRSAQIDLHAMTPKIAKTIKIVSKENADQKTKWTIDAAAMMIAKIPMSARTASV